MMRSGNNADHWFHLDRWPLVVVPLSRSLPKTQLPPKPASSYENPERLSEVEKKACKEAGSEAKNVCRKSEKNAIIAEDQQEFVERLYDTHDGK
jgi:hypothetical protein